MSGYDYLQSACACGREKPAGTEVVGGGETCPALPCYRASVSAFERERDCEGERERERPVSCFLAVQPVCHRESERVRDRDTSLE